MVDDDEDIRYLTKEQRQALAAGLTSMGFDKRRVIMIVTAASRLPARSALGCHQGER